MKTLLKYWVHDLRIVLRHAFDFQVPRLYETMTSTWWQSGTIYFFVKRDNLFSASIIFPDKCSSFHSLLQCNCLANFCNKLIAFFRQCSLLLSQNLFGDVQGGSSKENVVLCR